MVPVTYRRYRISYHKYQRLHYESIRALASGAKRSTSLSISHYVGHDTYKYHEEPQRNEQKYWKLSLGYPDPCVVNGSSNDGQHEGRYKDSIYGRERDTKGYDRQPYPAKNPRRVSDPRVIALPCGSVAVKVVAGKLLFVVIFYILRGLNQGICHGIASASEMLGRFTSAAERSIIPRPAMLVELFSQLVHLFV